MSSSHVTLEAVFFCGRCTRQWFGFYLGGDDLAFSWEIVLKFTGVICWILAGILSCFLEYVSLTDHAVCKKSSLVTLCNQQDVINIMDQCAALRDLQMTWTIQTSLWYRYRSWHSPRTKYWSTQNILCIWCPVHIDVKCPLHINVNFLILFIETKKNVFIYSMIINHGEVLHLSILTL